MGFNIIMGICHIHLAIITILVSLPSALGTIDMNPTMGIRTQKAMLSKENWDKMNRYGGKRLIVWSTVLLIVGIIILCMPVMSKPSDRDIALGMSPFLILAIPIVEIWMYDKKL